MTTRIATAVGSLVLALSLSSPVLAGHKSHKGHHHDDHRHAGETFHNHARELPRHPAHARYFAAPTWIGAYQAETYRPYYRGHVRYAPHGHAHAVYAFPVWQDHAWAYEARHYCGAELFPGNHVAYRGPSVSFRIAF